MTRTKPARDYLIEVAEQNGWTAGTTTRGEMFTRHSPPTRIDVKYSSQGGITTCSRNGVYYDGPQRCNRVAEWLMESPPTTAQPTTVTLPGKDMRVRWRGQDGTVTEVRIEVVIHLDGKLPGHLTIATPDEIEFESPR